MTSPVERPVERKLRALSAERRAVVAVRLAEVVEPLGVLAALTPGPLSTFADEIRRPTSPSAVEQTRQTLLGIPVLQENEEPDGPAWFALGAVVAWIYAADAVSGRDAEGVLHTFTRVEDVLDYTQDRLGIAGLCDRLYGAVTDATGGEDQPLIDLRGSLEQCVDRLRNVD